MKLNLDNFLLQYSSEISQAKANNFEILIIPFINNKKRVIDLTLEAA